MEILSETVHTGELVFYVIILGVASLGLLGLLIANLWMSIVEREFGFDALMLTVVCLLLGGLTSAGLIAAVNKGANVTYKATITDFNEVYENGYEIIGQDDKIYTLQKKNN